MKKVVTFIALIFLVGVVHAQSSNRIKFVEYDLDNGLHVILHEDHTTPIVAVSVMYHVGTKNENPERTGFAHFFEHLLFEGSENICDDNDGACFVGVLDGLLVCFLSNFGG